MLKKSIWNISTSVTVADALVSSNFFMGSCVPFSLFWYIYIFFKCAIFINHGTGVAGGAASGKTTVCDMIIQQLHDQRVVLVNQVITSQFQISFGSCLGNTVSKFEYLVIKVWCYYQDWLTIKINLLHGWHCRILFIMIWLKRNLQEFMSITLTILVSRLL